MSLKKLFKKKKTSAADAESIAVDRRAARLLADVLKATTQTHATRLEANDYSDITFTREQLGSEPDRIGQVLAREGVIVLKGFFDRELALRAERELTEALDRFDPEIQGSETVERDVAFIDHMDGPFDTFAALLSAPKAVITVRHTADQGMLDVTHADRLSPALQEMRADMAASKLNRFLSNAFDAELEDTNLNAYVNRSITSTRGFHIDSEELSVKTFAYLTDVTSMSDGPYCYVRGSHHDVSLRDVNTFIRTAEAAEPTDMPVIDHERAVALRAEAGDVIISNQAGAHRGWPQAAGARRLLAMVFYRRAEKKK